MTAYAPALDELRRAVDDELRAWLAERRSALPEAAELIDELTRVMEAGGKRLRPAFCYWGYRAAGKDHGSEIVRAAASLELLHTFAIVHDDMMDAADERRGVPTIHSIRGSDFALLAGDLALVLADALFASAGFSPEALVRGLEAYTRMRQEVIAGQFEDMRRSADAFITEDDARRIAVLKSGRYSVAEPLAIGAGLAGAPGGFRDVLDSYGEPLGEAFQMRDDLLGLFGDPSATGKPVDLDVRQGKKHVMYAKTVALLEGEERDWFVSRWGAGDGLADDEVDRLRRLVDACGARAETEARAVSLARAAARALEELQSDAESRSALTDLARLAVDREL
jgi:geranylgeranyl diphosphate synthase type I